MTATPAVTSFVYDWRNRQTDIDGELDFFQRSTYDNLNMVVKVERFDTIGQRSLWPLAMKPSLTTSVVSTRR